MPITFPPIPRRRFLEDSAKSILAGGFAAWVAGIGLPLFAEETPSRDTWAFLSDTHIPGNRETTGGRESIKPVEHLAKVRADILSGRAGRPCGVIVSGDCAYLQGKPEDYITLLAEFAPLVAAKLPVHFIMGNHDNREAFLHAMADEIGEKRPENIPHRLSSIVETPKADFYLMDSLERTNHSSGLFGPEQLQWLADELDSRKDKPAILVAHHYPDYTAAIAKNPHALTDTEAFFDRIRNRKQVKAYVFGHSHIWSTLSKEGIHMVNIPTTAWRFDRRQPCAWVLATLKDNGMTLRLRSIDPDHPKQDETIELAWR